MKKLIAVVVLALLAGYVWSPYYSIAKFEEALRSADKAAIEAAVDFPAVRASIKETLNSKAIGGANGRRDLISSAGAALAGVFVDGMVERVVTPEALVEALKLQAGAGGALGAFEEKRWNGIGEMTAKSNSGLVLVFRFSGLAGWKLVGVSGWEPDGVPDFRNRE